MNADTFATTLAAWQQSHGYRVREAAAALGCRPGTFCGWRAERLVPNYFTMCAVVRQMRDGHDPLTDVQMSAGEFAATLKKWRANYGFSQRQAGVAIGTSGPVVHSWETDAGVPRQPALGEILRRLRMPVDPELVKRASMAPPPIEKQEFAKLFYAWRTRCGLTRAEAAYALRSTGLRTVERTVWVWEAARELPNRPFAILDLIHGPLAVKPPTPPERKPLITLKEFATMLRDWRRKYCLTQIEACIALGLPRDQALISDWEKCKALPRAPRLSALVAALKQPPVTGPGTHNWYKARSNEFGQKLRAWRKARGLRQIEACALLGLPRDQGLICRYERGEASPRRERMVRILAIITGTEVQP